MKHGVSDVISVLVVLMLLAALAAAYAQGYTFTKVADSAEDGFDPFSFGCSSINNRGDIAFRAGRLAPDGFNTIALENSLRVRSVVATVPSVRAAWRWGWK
ncbi:MAG: hypothetical protein H0U16_07100 [Actinobacteria bacterium]|nr:hypothetical protein [Actinomycetota bacterium]